MGCFTLGHSGGALVVLFLRELTVVLHGITFIYHEGANFYNEKISMYVLLRGEQV